MTVGKLVYDFALGMHGIIIGDSFSEEVESYTHPGQRCIDWEWLVLYDDSELMGANTRDLQVIK